MKYTDEQIEYFAEQWFDKEVKERWGGETDGFIAGFKKALSLFAVIKSVCDCEPKVKMGSGYCALCLEASENCKCKQTVL